jgi:two-component system LytT family response regulator
VADKKMTLQAQINNFRKEYIFVPTEYPMERIELKDILFIVGMKDYLKIVTTQNKIHILQSFKRMLEILPSADFVLTHKSFVVALSKIENIERNRIKIGDNLIPISEPLKTKFYEAIDRLNRD